MPHHWVSVVCSIRVCPHHWVNVVCILYVHTSVFWSQDRREDTLLKLAHFRRHKRKALKKTGGKSTTYPYHKPEENHPPGKDSTQKISNLIGKAAKYAGSAKPKKVVFPSLCVMEGIKKELWCTC